MLELVLSTQFKKDLKKINKQGKDRQQLNRIVQQLQVQKPLSQKHHDHELSGNWKGYRESHITPDWLLIYKIHIEKIGLLRLMRTGSHSELFKK